jgi:hypothetical protein
MIGFYIILAAAPALLLVAVAFLALIVAGVRRGDRRDLASPPSSRMDGITRRVVGLGVRSKGEDEN